MYARNLPGRPKTRLQVHLLFAGGDSSVASIKTDARELLQKKFAAARAEVVVTCLIMTASMIGSNLQDHKRPEKRHRRM